MAVVPGAGLERLLAGAAEVTSAFEDAPVADAGPDQNVTENDVVTLDPSASSDVEGQALTYTWSQTGGPAVTLSDANAAQPTFMAPEAAGSHALTFQVAVNDGTTTTYDTVTINVTADDDAPVADAEDGLVQVSVVDEGPGLPDDLDVHSDRGDRGAVPVHGGRGLVLARDLVEGEGGRLVVRSGPAGTTAALLLPITFLLNRLKEFILEISLCAKQSRIDEIHLRPKIHRAVLQRRSCKDQPASGS